MTLLTRSVIVLPAAVIFSGLAFLSMVWLVAYDEVNPLPPRTPLPEFVVHTKPIIDVIPVEVTKPLPPPTTPLTPPPTVVGPLDPGIQKSVRNRTISPPTVTPPSQLSSTLLPMVTVAASYPARALQRGIEGYVDVEFDVDSMGRAVNCRVLEAKTINGTNTNAFNRAACSAVEQFRYRVPTVNDRPQGASNQRTRFTFDLND